MKRNDPCACGSGKKAKRCCLRLIADAPMNFARATARTDLSEPERLRLEAFKDRKHLSSTELKWLEKMSTLGPKRI